MQLPAKAQRPTMYFIGVTTGKSSIMGLFPRWAEALGLDAELVGIDLPLNASRQEYRDVVSFIKNDPKSLGALVTTHKINILTAARDLFDRLDPYAQLFSEISCIAKKDGELFGAAKDPISSGLAMEAFIPSGFWQEHGGEVFVIGAGGSARAILSYLLDPKHGQNRPARAWASGPSRERVQELAEIIEDLDTGIPLQTVIVADDAANDRCLEALPPYSLVINATGMGKDRPGSPLSDTAVFPQNSLIWELNYRGSLEFLHQARAQERSGNLLIEDGWVYFIHGWTQVIAEVFAIADLPQHIPKLTRIADDFLRS